MKTIKIIRLSIQAALMVASVISYANSDYNRAIYDLLLVIIMSVVLIENKSDNENK